MKNLEAGLRNLQCVLEQSDAVNESAGESRGLPDGSVVNNTSVEPDKPVNQPGKANRSGNDQAFKPRNTAGERGRTPPRNRHVPPLMPKGFEVALPSPSTQAQGSSSDSGSDNEKEVVVNAIKDLLKVNFEQQNRAINTQRAELSKEIKEASVESLKIVTNLSNTIDERFAKPHYEWYNVGDEGEFDANAGKDLPNAAEYVEAAEENKGSLKPRGKT